jgi:hypothetical protein
MMLLGENKHDNEVLFLQVAAGLNLMSLYIYDVLQKYKTSEFEGLIEPRPTKPAKPQEPTMKNEEKSKRRV